MQPVPGLPFPSASMGAEWMGSDSEELDVRVKSVAKESIVVCEMCGSRDVMNLSGEQARSSSPFKLSPLSFCSCCRHSKFCVMLALVLSLVIVRVRHVITAPSALVESIDPVTCPSQELASQ